MIIKSILKNIAFFRKDLHTHNKKIKMITNRRKSGFTLIEVIAVIAIIGILASIMLPKFNNYINEAKKLKVVDQSRKVVMAVESYNLKYTTPIEMGTKVSEVINKEGVKKYLEGVTLDKLDTGETTLKNCYDIVNGAEFGFSAKTDILDPSKIIVINTSTTSNVNKS